jgi:hypothetical protein
LRFYADPLVEAGNRHRLRLGLFDEGGASRAVPQVLTSVRKSFLEVAQDQELFGIIGVP